MSSEERLRELERANEELRRANAALARERQGSFDTGAAGALLRLRDTEARLAAVESSLSWRLTAPLRWAKSLVMRVVRGLRPGRRPGPG